jgi:hypothetical protein
VGDGVGAFCDERGASAIAAPRVHSIGDDRIEAAPGSGAELDESISIGPGPRHRPAASVAPVLATHAVLDVVVMVPPASSELVVYASPASGGPRAGVARGIDHPPR